MVISRVDQKIFFHIPKNGGSALRHYFLSTWHEAQELQGRKFVARANRVIDLTHATASEAALVAPEFDLPESYERIIIVRSPLDRFKSALMQHIQSFQQDSRSFICYGELQSILSSMDVESLCTNSMTDYTKVYFRRQVDYVTSNEMTFLEVSEIDKVMPRNYSVPSNSTGNLPRILRRLESPGAAFVRDKLPRSLKVRLKNALTKRNRDLDLLVDDFTSESLGFLTEFYFRDIQLFEKVSNAIR